MVKEMKEGKGHNTIIMYKNKKSNSNSMKTRKGLWSPEEDEKLMSYMLRNGHGCWSDIARNAGLQRCGKSCRLRWINYLRPDLKRGAFSPQEEALILHLHSILGNRWSQIAARLPGRTDNEIKNFWNSNIKKRLKTNNFHPSSTCSPNDANDHFSTSTSLPELDPINGGTSFATMPTIALSSICKDSLSSSASSYTSSPSSLHPSPLATYNTLLESLSRQVLLGNYNIVDNEMIMGMDGTGFGGFNVASFQDEMGSNWTKGFNGGGGVYNYGFGDGDDNKIAVEKDIFGESYSIELNTGVGSQYYDNANEATTVVESDAAKATNSPLISCNNIGFEIQREWDFETLLLGESLPFLEFQA